MRELNFQQFKSKLKKSTRKVFLQLTKEYNDICAFGLYSDESAMSIAVSFNTESYFKEMWESDPDEKESYRWFPGEWFCESYQDSKDFDKLNKQISPNSSLNESFPTTTEFLEFRDNLYNTAVEVLSELKDEGLFSEFTNEFILLFAVSEFENEEKQIEWVEKLNSEKLSNEFEEWLKE